MILYHGTNADFDRISLTIGLRHKDFGWGFYLTPDRQTAVRMAQKKARLFGGTPTLITYELDEAALQSDLKIKRFPETATVDGRQLHHGTDSILTKDQTVRDLDITLIAFLVREILLRKCGGGHHQRQGQKKKKSFHKKHLIKV